MEGKTILIIGAGGFGREVAAMICNTRLSLEYNFRGFIDDGYEKGSRVNGSEVLGGTAELLTIKEETSVALAIGNPAIRRNIYQKIKSNKALHFPNIIHPSVKMHNSNHITLGYGNIICDGTILTTNIKIGNLNLVNLASTIGHDTEIANYCSIMPGVNISGGAMLQDEVYVGTGARLIKATVLGERSVVGAGAVVNANLDADTTYVGIPARPVTKP